MNEQDEIQKAIAALEEQRPTLGSAAVDAALEGLRRKLAEFELPQDGSFQTARQAIWTGERKLVTILFADISGFTALSEKADPEIIRGYINACFTNLVPVIEKYGGTVEKFIGDEIMAFFGAPVAHENDEERSLLAALEMMARLEEFNAKQGLNFKIHIGVNTGLVVTGSIGTPEQQQYGVTGDAVNLASRLADQAESGQIFVGPETYRLTAPLFEYAALEPVRVKGKSDPVPIYQVVGVKGKPGKVRGLEVQGIHSPLVARDAELAAIRGRLDRLRQGEGSVIGIIGEAGLGKSRLLAEIRAQAQSGNEGFNWLEGYTLSYGQTISYWPFQVILRRWAGLAEEDREAEAWKKLERKVTSLFEDQTIDILPYLAGLLAIEARGEYAERVKYLDAESMGKQIFIASRRFFDRLARQRATVLVFEDLHWVDESSAGLLEHILPLTRSAPLLIIGLTRPDSNTPMVRLRTLLKEQYAGVYTELRLQPLSSLDSQELIGNLLEIEDLPAQIRELIVSKAEGNPFFVEEVIRSLMESGMVKKDAATGRWKVTAQIETITIPSTIQGVIIARIDRLNEQAKQVLRVASVIGRSFLYRVLKAVSNAGSRLDESLASLEQLELIHQKQYAPELEYIFKHTLAQEATYESILLQKRRELHSMVGQVIETLFAGRLEEFYGLLAYHYAKAEAWEKAQDFLLKAGDQAGRIAADAEALHLYQQAMTVYAHGLNDRWDPVQQAAIKRKIGEAFQRRGENTRAREYFQQALSHLGRDLPGSRTKLRQAILVELATQAGHRVFSFRNQTLVKQVSPAVEEEYRIFLALISVDVLLDQEFFLYETLKCLNCAEQNQHDYGIILASAGVGLICDFISAFRLAGYYHRRAIRLGQQAQYSIPLGMAYFCLALENALQGNFSAVEENCLLSARYLSEAGNFHEWGLTLETLAQILTYQDKYSQAQEYAQVLIRTGQEGAEEALKCWGWVVSGMIARRAGPLEEAVDYFQKVIEVAKAIPDNYSYFIACGELGLCYLEQGRLDQALEILEPAWKAGRGQRIGNSITPVYNGLAEAYLVALEQSYPFEGSAALQKAALQKAALHKTGLKNAAQACKAALAQGKAFRGGMPQAMRLRGRYAWLQGRPEEARQWWERSLVEAGRMGMRYERAMTCLEMGQRLEDPDRHREAEAIFVEIRGELAGFKD